MTTSYADWSPASVFGPTSAPPATSMHARGPLVAAGSIHNDPRRVLKPEKLLVSRSTSPLRLAHPVNNNDESCGAPTVRAAAVRRRRRDTRSRQRKQELAAQLLQRQAREWLLRRQEAQCVGEVQRLRGELHHAAKRVVSESCVRYVKRRAIRGYLGDVEAFEARLSSLLAHFLARKRQKEQLVQQLEVIRRQQCQEEQQRQDARRRELAAEALLISWTRRWKLCVRCNARAVAKAKEQQRWEQLRLESAFVIAHFYQAAKLQRHARQELQRRRRLCAGIARLSHVVEKTRLRRAQTQWQQCVARLKHDDAVAGVLQRLWRAHKTSSLRAKRSASRRLLQRIYRGHLGRIDCTKRRALLQQEQRARRRHHAATQLQRHARGLLARRQFAETLRRLRERFRCTNCGVIEPGGAYCKLCGRRRKVFGPKSSIVLLQGPRTQANDAAQPPRRSLSRTALPVVHTPVLPPPRRRALRLPPASSTRTTFPISSLDPLMGLPALLSHHPEASAAATTMPRRAVVDKHCVPARRHSAVTLSEQTALRAAVLTDLQTQYAASAQAQALNMHLARLHKANVTARRQKDTVLS